MAKTAAADKNRDNLSIEELMSRLEEITRNIENPDTGIERSIALYEEGLAIAGKCRDRLQEARKKIEVINPDIAKTWPDNARTKDLFDS
ncbi:MAG: exodeoxyribonuclease VII small subunit [Chlorobium sp.]|uniref:exodeoxyribonuclease VII small subunit n=1 Tax=Chlorobium sp. TaxID=1095 RepID=UPI002F41BA3B